MFWQFEGRQVELAAVLKFIKRFEEVLECIGGVGFKALSSLRALGAMRALNAWLRLWRPWRLCRVRKL